MRDYKVIVPTYNADLFPLEVEKHLMPEFGSPEVPVLVYLADGLRVVLGTHDPEDMDKPDIQIERQPNGWVIFLHPVGGSDASGCVYFHDDGRSFVIPETNIGPTLRIEARQPNDEVPGFSPPRDA